MRPLPFPVKAWFDFFVVLFFSIDKNEAAKRIPFPLQLDLHNEKALLAVAAVQTKNFRPAFLPSFMGRNFNLVGYRFLTTYERQNGDTIRGLKIIRSQTNQSLMKFWGDRFTQYKFEYNPLEFNLGENEVRLTGEGINIELRKHADPQSTPLPAGSCFADWKYARKYAGPLLYTFETNETTKTISITEGTRKNWQPKPIETVRCEIDFLRSPEISSLNPVLSAAYMVQNIPYDWKKAVIENYSHVARKV
jgi:hypothetical protein